MRACLKVGGMNDGGQAGGLNGLKKGDMLIPMLEKVCNLPVVSCFIIWNLETCETQRLSFQEVLFSIYCSSRSNSPAPRQKAG